MFFPFMVLLLICCIINAVSGLSLLESCTNGQDTEETLFVVRGSYENIKIHVTSPIQLSLTIPFSMFGNRPKCETDQKPDSTSGMSLDHLKESIIKENTTSVITSDSKNGIAVVENVKEIKKVALQGGNLGHPVEESVSSLEILTAFKPEEESNWAEYDKNANLLDSESIVSTHWNENLHSRGMVSSLTQNLNNNLDRNNDFDRKLVETMDNNFDRNVDRNFGNTWHNDFDRMDTNLGSDLAGYKPLNNFNDNLDGTLDRNNHFDRKLVKTVNNNFERNVDKNFGNTWHNNFDRMNKNLGSNLAVDKHLNNGSKPQNWYTTPQYNSNQDIHTENIQNWDRLSENANSQKNSKSELISAPILKQQPMHTGQTFEKTLNEKSSQESSHKSSSHISHESSGHGANLDGFGDIWIGNTGEKGTTWTQASVGETKDAGVALQPLKEQQYSHQSGARDFIGASGLKNSMEVVSSNEEEESANTQRKNSTGRRSSESDSLGYTKNEESEEHKSFSESKSRKEVKQLGSRFTNRYVNPYN